MIKLLYDNGHILDYNVINPNIERTINGSYFLEFEIPIDSSVANLIKENMELEADIPNGQTDYFRVRLIRKDLDTIYFYCTQVFFSLGDNFIEDTNIVSKNGLGAMLQISGATQYSHNFNFFSDIAVVNNARMVRKNVVSALLGDEDNSFISRWGGELDINKYNVKMLSKLGSDKGVKIEYRKNLTGLDGTIDYSTYYTRCMPQGFDGLFLDEKYVDSPNIDPSHPVIRVVEFPDIKVKENEDDIGYNTEAEAKEALKQAVLKLYEQGADVPKASYEISFVELSSTEEYKNYSILESIWIGDTVTVKHDSFEIKARCVHYSFNPISKRYNSISLGEVTTGIVESSNDIKDKIDEAINSGKDDYAKYLENAIKEATDLINQGLGGHAYKTRNEFLILDTEDIMTAVKVLRINQNGIGFSSTGYAGPYSTAITSDGKLVITEATAEKFVAALIQGGILQSLNNKSWINLDDGTFNFANKIKFDGEVFAIDLSQEDLSTNLSFQNLKEELKENIKSDIDTVVESVTNLNNYVNGSLKDGILTEAEKEGIKSNLSLLQSEKAKIDGSYSNLYYNIDLINKTTLKTAYDNYISKYNTLISAIDSILNSDEITIVLQEALTTAFNNHNTSLNSYYIEANNAINDIAEKKKQDGLTTSNTYTDAQVKFLSDEFSVKISAFEENQGSNLITNGDFKNEKNDWTVTKTLGSGDASTITTNNNKQWFTATNAPYKLTQTISGIDVRQRTIFKARIYLSDEASKPGVSLNANIYGHTLSTGKTLIAETGTTYIMKSSEVYHQLNFNFNTDDISKYTSFSIEILIANNLYPNTYYMTDLKLLLMTDGNYATVESVTQLATTVNGVTASVTKVTTDLDTTKKEVSALSVKAGSIESTVSSHNSTLNTHTSDISSIKQTATSLSSTVSSQGTRLGNAESKITQQANLIESKVDVNGVKSTIQQNPDSVKIGFNGISNRFGVDDYGFYLANNSGTKVLNADTSGNLNMNIWGGRLRISATGTRKAEMWCDVYDRFIMNIPYTQEGSGIWIKRDTGATILVDTARADNPYYKIYIGEMTSPAIKTGYLNVTGGLDVAGAKNCLVDTENYGKRRISAYETAEYYFGDLGFGEIVNGECIVVIDDMFQECVNTNIEYHVFTQVYNGAITNIERYRTYFIVRGKEGTEFSWELKAKRIGYENARLELQDITETLDVTQEIDKFNLLNEVDIVLQETNKNEDLLTYELYLTYEILNVLEE